MSITVLDLVDAIPLAAAIIAGYVVLACVVAVPAGRLLARISAEHEHDRGPAAEPADGHDADVAA